METLLRDPPGSATDLATVLVVDDSAFHRRFVGHMLGGDRGLAVAFAADGEEALGAVELDRPAVVLTDLEMPGLDGLGLVEELGRRHPGLPVVLMTAHGSESLAVEALRRGAAGYVPKQAMGASLLRTVRQVLDLAAAEGMRRRLLGCYTRREADVEIGNDPALIGPLVDQLGNDLSGLGLFDEATRMRVGVALQEALSNALYHGNLGVGSDLRQEDERAFYDLAERRRVAPPYRDRRIRVRMTLDRRGARYRIRDEGPGFDVSAMDRPVAPEDLTRVGGRGLLLIRTFMDEVAFNDAGNEVTLVKRPGRSRSAGSPAGIRPGSGG